MITVNTENILFICGGAFDGMNKVIAKRINTRPIGFSSDKDRTSVKEESLLRFVNAQDLKSFGLIPELVGRLPVVTYLEPLSRDVLRSILTVPRNALVKQYKKLFEMEGISLSFTETALDFIVEKAMEFRLGARGLRSICEAIVTDAMFEMPSKEDVKNLNITKPYAEEKFNKSKFTKLKVA
jgi:ATP-dependent Clp protease ATP-binding subunit ClpX